MSDSNWRDWALGEGDECPDDNAETWRRVAENADCDARYENPNVQPEAYRNALGERHPPLRSNSTMYVGIRTISSPVTLWTGPFRTTWRVACPDRP